MKSVQWLQNVGCLKKRAMNLWSLTSCTFFWRRAPWRAKPLAAPLSRRSDPPVLELSPSLLPCSRSAILTRKCFEIRRKERVVCLFQKVPPSLIPLSVSVSPRCSLGVNVLTPAKPHTAGSRLPVGPASLFARISHSPRRLSSAATAVATCCWCVSEAPRAVCMLSAGRVLRWNREIGGNEGPSPLSTPNSTVHGVSV